MRSRIRGTSLGAKVALLSALVTAMVVALAFVVLRIETEANVRRVFVKELSASQTTLGRFEQLQRQLLLETASMVSTSSPNLRAALQTWHVEANNPTSQREQLETIRREAENVGRDLNRDLVVVTDTAGIVLAAIGKGELPRPGESLMGLPALRNALSVGATIDSAFGVLGMGGKPIQVGCMAILLDGFPIGAVLVGERVDRLVPTPIDSADIRAVLTAGDSVMASTLAQAPAGRRWAAQLDEPGVSGDLARTLLLDRDEFVTATLSLGLAADGRPATLYLMRPLSASLAQVDRSLLRSFLFIGILALLLTALGGVIASRTTLRPLSRFVTFLGSDAATAESARFDDPSAPIEIVTLTDTYNRLIVSLRRERQALEQRTSDLATTNETLRRQVQERQRAERALRESEEQLRQAQKLEALGALAGGVAHDFNNMLSVILGYTEVTLEELPSQSHHRKDLDEIHAAGRRAKALVDQLLAFSRKQVLRPQVLDLNRVVKSVQPMLTQLIGENIRVETNLTPELGRIMADPGQIEQVLMNLAVNARDAMPNGGTLVIETANTELDAEGPTLPMAPGPAVMLSVRDTGIGMDATTRRLIFDPFFTTKPIGQGTGLGLATVYGIVRQSEGSITVFSEPNKGATFRCYFPPVASPPPAAVVSRSTEVGGSGNETVLLAEDEGQLRALLSRGLRRRGYTVLEASDGTEALELAEGYLGRIDVLVTDMVMPFLSGKELAERLLESLPELRVIFISGYSEDAIERHGVLTPGSVFLRKPIMPDALARAIREILDSAPVLEKVE